MQIHVTGVAIGAVIGGVILSVAAALAGFALGRGTAPKEMVVRIQPDAVAILPSKEDQAKISSQLRSAQERWLVNAAETQVGMFKTPLDMYQLDLGAYPSSSAGLEALRSAPGDARDSKWAGPYMERALPLDPWGRQYRYTNPGKHNPDSYDTWSFGPDGRDGTNDDIGNW